MISRRGSVGHVVKREKGNEIDIEALVICLLTFAVLCMFTIRNVASTSTESWWSSCACGQTPLLTIRYATCIPESLEAC